MLSDKQKEQILNACEQLTHCNGYRESQGPLWIDGPIVEILDAIGLDYRLTTVFDNVARESNRGTEL